MAQRLLFCLLLTSFLVIDGQAQMLDDIAELRTPLGAQSVDIVGKRAVHSVVSEAVLVPFTGIAVEAYSKDAGISAQVRIEENGVWGDWHAMSIVRSAVGDGLVAGYRGSVRTGPARFEVRFTVANETSLEVRDAGTFDNRSDEDGLPVVSGLKPIAAKTTGIIIPPPLITRAEWGAKAFIGTPSRLANPTHEYMTFHHAAGYSAATRAQGLAQMRAIQELHQDIRGWSDIGYQFLIDQGGNLYQGRPFLNNATSLSDLPVFALGAHVGGANTGNIGVSILGCYHPPEGGNCIDQITPEAYDTYVTLFAFLSERYGVPASQIRGHRDFSSTACPGDNNYVLLPSLRRDVGELLLTGNAAIAEATLTAASDADGIVTVSWEFLADFGVASHRIERWVSDAREAVLLSGPGATASSLADGTVVTNDPVSYRLYVTDSDGREQRVAIVEVTIETPTRHAMAEVFPNPASGMVRFRYFLPSEGRVTLEVFDTAGRSVTRLVEDVQDGDSWYAVPFDTQGLPGGVYFYRVLVEGFAGIAFDKTGTLVVNP
ncbi:MAG: hypothetical protein ACI80V_002531 [Rhodothermales bacterium]|jgi:hypothetical protein